MAVAIAASIANAPANQCHRASEAELSDLASATRGARGLLLGCVAEEGVEGAGHGKVPGQLQLADGSDDGRVRPLLVAVASPRTPAPATEVNPSAATGHAGGYFSPLYFFLLSFLFLSPAFIRIATRQYYFLCYLLSLCSSPSSCSEERKPLYRADPATSTSFNTSSSRYTSVAPFLLPSPLLILSNHRRCVSSLFSSIGQLEI